MTTDFTTPNKNSWFSVIRRQGHLYADMLKDFHTSSAMWSLLAHTPLWRMSVAPLDFGQASSITLGGSTHISSVSWVYPYIEIIQLLGPVSTVSKKKPPAF